MGSEMCIRDRNYKAGVKETDDFATYLRDVEKRGQISSEERAGWGGRYIDTDDPAFR